MANEELLVTLGVQDKGTTTKIRALNKELKSLDTQYRLADKSSGGFDNSLNGLQKKLTLIQQKIEAHNSKLSVFQKRMKEAQEGVSKKTEELEKLRKEQGDNISAIAKTEKQLATYQKQLHEAENGIKETESQLELLTAELENTNKAIANFDMAKMSKQLKESGENIEKMGDKLQNAGTHMNNVGNKLIALSAPMVAFSGYAVKAGVDFEKSMSKTGALANASASEIELLSNAAKEMGESIAGASATEIADSFGYLALAGYNVNEMLSAIEPNVKASIAWGADMATNADGVTDSLSALGLRAEDTARYLDVLTQAQNSSNTSGQELLEAYKVAGGMFRDWNTPLEESTALLGILANRGIKGAEAGTSLNSILINLMGTTSTTGAAMKALGVQTYDAQGNFRGVETVLKEVGKSMGNMNQQQEDMLSSMLGGKTQIDTLKALLAGLGDEYDTLKSTISDSGGALEKMYKTMSSTTAGQIETFKSKLESLGLQLADHLLPHINNLLDKGMALIDWFASLDDETQKTIVSTALFATATGGALKVIGGFTSNIGGVVKAFGSLKKSLGESVVATDGATKGVGSLVAGINKLGIGIPHVAAAIGVLGAGIYTYNEYQDAMNKKVTDAREDMSLLERAFLNMNGVQAKSRAELEELGLVYKEFNSNISTEFQDKVKNMTKEVQDFGIELREMNLDGTFSETEIKSVQDRFSSMIAGLNNTITQKYSEVGIELNKIYSADGIIDETEQSLINYWNERKGIETQQVNDIQNAINEIINNAKGRELTAEEIASLENYYQQLKVLELQLAADNSYELEYAKSEFQQRIAKMDAESASELLKERKAQYEQEQMETNAHYDALIATITSGKETLTEEDKKIIESLNSKREEELQKSKQYYDDAYNYAMESNENLKGVINKYNGEILNEIDKSNYERLSSMEAHYDGLLNITESGYHSVYNKTTESWDNIYAKVDEKTGQLIGVYNLNSNEVGSMTKKIGQSLEEEVQDWRETADGVLTSNLTMKNAYLDTENNIRNSSDKIIGKLKEVVDENGNVVSSVIEVNGKPINLQGNMDDIIKQLKNTQQEVKNTDGKKATIKVDDGGSITSFGQRLKNLWSGIFGGGNSYAIGTSNAPEGVHTINEKGWELVDPPQGKVAIGLGTNLLGDSAYLPRGTKVRTNLSSTEMMMKAVRNEVSSQLSKIDFTNSYYLPTTQPSTILREGNINSNSNADLISSMNTMISLLSQLVTKDTNIYMDSKKVGRTLANEIDEQIAKKARARI